MSIAVINPYPDGTGVYDHLHLSYGSGTLDPTFAIADAVQRPIDDPLDRLVSIGDVTAPVVSTIAFRLGGDDTSGKYPDGKTESRPLNHGYFTDTDVSLSSYSPAYVLGEEAIAYDSLGILKPGTSAIDIIAEATDRVRAGGTLVGVRSIGFEVLAGHYSGATSGEITSVDFDEEFTQDPANGNKQTHAALGDRNLVRTVYESDAQSPSQDYTQYFHTVTNTDEDGVVELSDRPLYWATDRVAGSKWNATSAAQAANNARSGFPDDYYKVSVTAYDQAGNASADKSAFVLLDNWRQAITLDITTMPGKVIVSGSQFLPNAKVPIYGYPAGKELLNGGKISAVAGAPIDTANTNADGKLTLVFTRNDAKYKTIVADYGADDLYVNRLDTRHLIGDMIGGAGLRMSVSNGDALADTAGSGEGDPAGGSGDHGGQGFLPPDHQPGGYFFAPPPGEMGTKPGALVQVAGSPDFGFRPVPPPVEPVGITPPTFSGPLALDPADALALDSSGPAL
ncbi:MAG: hypothetical protein K2X87_26820 [Gemmataceae bacterium]|nr:hypothetical protein [Gemmataceae bacterium]